LYNDIMIQSEISRLKSRLAEVEAGNVVLTDQLDRSLISHLSETKDLQRALDRSDHEASRLQEKVHEGDERVRELQAKCGALEREVLGLQDIMFKKERLIKDLNGKMEALGCQREELRASLVEEIQSVKQELSEEKQRYSELMNTHRKELSDLQREVEKKLPSLAADVAAQAEAHFSDQLLGEVSAVQAKCQRQVEALKKEMFDMQSSHSETMGRMKASSSEDKIELERLRQKCQLLEARHGDMEVMIENMRHKERQQMLQIQWGDTNPAETKHVALAAGEGSGRAPPPRSSQSGLGLGKGQRVAFERAPETSSIGEDDSVTLDRFIDGETMNSITDELAEMRKQLTKSLNATKPAGSFGTTDTQHRISSGVDQSSDSSSSVDVTSRPQRQQRVSPHRDRARERSAKRSSPTKGSRRDASSGTMSMPSVMADPSSLASARHEASQEFGNPRTPRRVSTKAAYSPEALFISPDAARHHPPAQQPQYLRSFSAGGVGPAEAVSFSMVSDSSYSRQEPSLLHGSSSRPTGREGGMGIGAGRATEGWSSSVMSDVEDFSAIHDGGYHAGYWKAKYLRGAH
jgi:myosin heavy subunit